MDVSILFGHVVWVLEYFPNVNIQSPTFVFMKTLGSVPILLLKGIWNILSAAQTSMLMLHHYYRQAGATGRRRSAAANNGWRALSAEEEPHTWAMVSFKCFFRRALSWLNCAGWRCVLRKSADKHFNPNILKYLSKVPSSPHAAPRGLQFLLYFFFIFWKTQVNHIHSYFFRTQFRKIIIQISLFNSTQNNLIKAKPYIPLFHSLAFYIELFRK